MHVVVDAMGSDQHPSPEVDGALRAVAQEENIHVTLVGDRATLSAIDRVAHERISIVHASERVTMEDHPASAFRSKPDSSLRRAVELVAAGEGDAVVSAGNSGAMVVAATLTVGRLARIERPAIVVSLPTPTGPIVLCDAGANVDPKPGMLAQFGRLGVAYDRAVHERARPRLGLLSNGFEPGKGTALTRATYELLVGNQADFAFVGYVEGNDLFRGVVDVVATDGFTGNVVLKTCEGIAEMFGTSYRDTGGALLAGVNAPVVIAHGRSDAVAVCNAIRAAARFAREGLVQRIAALTA